MLGARLTNATLAIWLGISAVLGFSVAGNVINLVTVGSIVAGIGIALAEDSKWQGRTSTAVGLWLIAAPALPFLRNGTGLLWNSLTVGAVVLLVSIPFGGSRAARSKSSGASVQPPSADEVRPGQTSARPWRDNVENGARELAHR